LNSAKTVFTIIALVVIVIIGTRFGKSLSYHWFYEKQVIETVNKILDERGE
jgi:hypothetical protein